MYITYNFHFEKGGETELKKYQNVYLHHIFAPCTHFCILICHHFLQLYWISYHQQSNAHTIKKKLYYENMNYIMTHEDA